MNRLYGMTGYLAISGEPKKVITLMPLSLQPSHYSAHRE